MQGSKHVFVVELRAPVEWDPEFTKSTMSSALSADLALTDLAVHGLDDTAKTTMEFCSDIRRIANWILKQAESRNRLTAVELTNSMLSILGLVERLLTRLLVLHRELNDARGSRCQTT